MKVLYYRISRSALHGVLTSLATVCSSSYNLTLKPRRREAGIYFGDIVNKVLSRAAGRVVLLRQRSAVHVLERERVVLEVVAVERIPDGHRAVGTVDSDVLERDDLWQRGIRSPVPVSNPQLFCRVPVGWCFVACILLSYLNGMRHQGLLV